MTAAALKKLRLRLGLTQVAFAERIGIAPNSLARMERGESTMRRTTEIAIQVAVAAIEAEQRKRR